MNNSYNPTTGHHFRTSAAATSLRHFRQWQWKIVQYFRGEPVLCSL